MANLRSYRAFFLLIGALATLTPIRSIPTKRKLIIVPQERTIRSDELQIANNKKTYIASDFQATLLELLDELYEQTNYWQGKQSHAKKADWQQHVNTALDCLYNEIDYQAALLATVTEWLNAKEPTRNKINLVIPTDCNTYKKEVLDRVAPYKIPSHVSRHWVKYTIGAACAVGAVAYCHHNRESLVAFATNTQESAKDFLYSHACKPLRNSYNIIFGKRQEKPFISPESIEQDEDITRAMIREYFNDNNPEKLSPEQIDAIAQDAIHKRELPQKIADHYTEETKQPVKKLLSPYGQLGRLGIILGHIKALRFVDIIQEVDALRQANKLNLELMVAIPTALVGYGTYRTLKGIYRYANPAEKNYAPIKQNILNIDRILNSFNNTKQTITDEAKGKIIYWLHKLSQLEYLVPVDQRESFFGDLAELYSIELSIKQKLRTIDRMYRTYAFLNFKAAY